MAFPGLCFRVLLFQVQLAWTRIKAPLREHATRGDKIVPFLLKFRDIVERLALHLMLDRLAATSEVPETDRLVVSSLQNPRFEEFTGAGVLGGPSVQLCPHMLVFVGWVLALRGVHKTFMLTSVGCRVLAMQPL